MKGKHALYLLVVVALLAGTWAIPAAAQTKPKVDGPAASTGTATRAGIEDISGSYTEWDGGSHGDMCWAPGTNTLCFYYHVESYTWAWPSGLNLKLPDGWTPINGWLEPDWSCTGGGYPGDLYFSVNGSEAVFGQTWYLGSSGDECDAFYCVEVTAAGDKSPDEMPWYINSDGYGGGVVDTCDYSGYYSCDEAVMPPADVPPCQEGIYLTPAYQEGSGCGGDSVDYTLNLFNNTLTDYTFDLSYAATWPTSGPASLFVAAGDVESFGVSVSIPCGGESDTATVTAEGLGYIDTADIYTTISAGGWIGIDDSPVATMDQAAIEYDGKLYVVNGYGSGGAVQIFDGAAWTLGAYAPASGYIVDACLGMDAAGNPVIDIFGDTSEFFNVMRYDINANSWSTFAFPPGFPSGGVWAHDIVSMLQHTGENVCYISGGATTPGGGNLNSLLAYDPATQTITDLGDFSYSPYGIDFHFSWYVPWIGAAGALCIGGGVDVNSVVYGDTQCYWIAEATFNTPNADLGQLPQPWWGGGDAWKEHEGQYQIWGFNGVDAAFALLQKSFYWDGSAFVYGPDPIHAVYRMEGDNFLDSVFAANGSTGGFTYSTLEEWLLQCPPCGENILTAADIEGVFVMDYLGRPVLRARVLAWDQNMMPVPDVAVTAWIWTPTAGPIERARWTKGSGWARFHWGSPISGDWQLCVKNMEKAGYTWDGVELCETWNGR